MKNIKRYNQFIKETVDTNQRIAQYSSNEAQAQVEDEIDMLDSGNDEDMYIGDKLTAELYEMLKGMKGNLSMDNSGAIKFDGFTINWYSETNKFSVDTPDGKTINIVTPQEVVDYIMKNNTIGG